MPCSGLGNPSKGVARSINYRELERWSKNADGGACTTVVATLMISPDRKNKWIELFLKICGLFKTLLFRLLTNNSVKYCRTHEKLYKQRGISVCPVITIKRNFSIHERLCMRNKHTVTHTLDEGPNPLFLN